MGRSRSKPRTAPWIFLGLPCTRVDRILPITAADVWGGISSDPATCITSLSACLPQERGSLCACHPVHLFPLKSPWHIRQFGPNLIDM